MEYFCRGSRPYIAILFILISAPVFADKISSPPPLQKVCPECKQDTALYHYLREIYENFHRLEIVTSTPNGSRQGKKGDMVVFQTGGISYLAINTDSSTTWSGVVLTTIP